MSRQPNHRLADLMREADISAKSLARAIRDAGAGAAKCDHTSVSRWLDGTQPRGRTAELLCEVLSNRLGRVITPADAGLTRSAEPGRDGEPPEDLAGLVARLGATDTNDADIDRLSQTAYALAESHTRAPARSVLDQVLVVHRQARALQGRRMRLSQQRDVFRIESEVLAHACLLLGDLRNDELASQFGAAALRYAEEAGVSEALACTALAKTYRWQNRLMESAEIARRGYGRSPATPVRTQLAAQEANAAALFGDVRRAREAMGRAGRDAEIVAPDSGVSAWSFGRGRQAVFALSVANQTGDPTGALRAASVADAGWADGEPKVPANWAQVRLGAATAYLALGDLDTAAAEIASVLDLRPELRIATVTAYMDALIRRLGRARYVDSKPAAELRQSLRDFNAGALPEAGTDQ